MNDITKHKWSDDLINIRSGAKPVGDALQIHHEGDYSNCESISLNKDDAIAIAKHFGLLSSNSKPITPYQNQAIRP